MGTFLEVFLYIRPLFATDPYVELSLVTYKFMIFTCPVGAYYSSSVPVKIETKYSRAVSGGTGFAKAGNYAAALFPAKLGQDQGFTSSYGPMLKNTNTLKSLGQ